MPTRGKITLGGEERELRFTLRSLHALEELGGKNITDPEFLDWARSTGGLGYLLYAGLLHEGRGESLEEIEEKIDIGDIGPLVDQMLEAFTGSLPDPNVKTVRAKSAPKPRRSTGSTSGELVGTT